MEKRQRATAYKVPLKMIIEGNYVKDGEEFAPNYIEKGNMKIARANVIGIVVSSDQETSPRSLLVDDGTAKMQIRGFDDSDIPENIQVGDIVNIIGRPREFNSEKYIVPEIIKKTEQKWMRVRKLELSKEIIPEQISEQAPEKIKEQAVKTEDIKDPDKGEGFVASQEKIIEYIKKKDDGKGIPIEELISNCPMENCEGFIEDMLKEGDLFENLPGKVKILE